MSKGIKICNLNFEGDKNFDEFEIDGYKFLAINTAIKENFIYTSQYFVHYHRKHRVTCKVIVPKRQNDSIIFKGGRITQKFSESQTGRKRKFIEDILLLISLLIGRNVVLYSRRNYGQFPVIPFKNLEPISSNSDELKADLLTTLQQIKNNEWQSKYDNGFHLIMLYIHANILHIENRFLANFVIWEWLFAHLFGKESRDLTEIFSSILREFWESNVNKDIYKRRKNNIFTVLRHQLAHSGKFPIDRTYSKNWMKKLNLNELICFLDFFNKLTQVVVLKTLGLNCEKRITGFYDLLKQVLKHGKI